MRYSVVLVLTIVLLSSTSATYASEAKDVDMLSQYMRAEALNEMGIMKGGWFRLQS